MMLFFFSVEGLLGVTGVGTILEFEEELTNPFLVGGARRLILGLFNGSEEVGVGGVEVEVTTVGAVILTFVLGTNRVS